MSTAAGAKKPSESQTAKALWAVKAAKDRRINSTTQPAKKTFWGEGNRRRLELWEEYLKDPIRALDKALKCVETQYQG